MPYAQVELKDGQIYSTRYDDIYYNTDDGTAESEYVFLGGNDLPERWRGKPHFCIAETGFGSGLNFLITLKAWLSDSARCKTLHYFAIEAFPLCAADLRKVHAQWPELQIYSKQLIENYPGQTSGCHSLLFEQGQVQLHLIFETIEFTLKHYHLYPDCWFLDGFAPAKNPSMWTKKVLNQVALQSRPDTSLATFTAAGDVRRNLISAGFEVRKRKGFGCKREMLCAHMPTSMGSSDTAQNHLKNAPWFAPAHVCKRPEKVAVAGAGIAGAQTAWHLAQHGVKVVVIEQEAAIATAASGNRAGMLAPKLSAIASVEESFYLAAFEYQLRQIKILEQQGNHIHFVQHGLIHLAYNQHISQRFERMSVREDLPESTARIISANEASRRLGEKVDQACLFNECAGSLSPTSLCHALLSHPNIELRLSSALTGWSYKDGKPQLLLSEGARLNVDALVLANGHQAVQFSGNTPLTPVRGQTSSAQLSQQQTLPHVLRHAGYMVSIPGQEQRVIFGASYVRGETADDLREEETRQDIDNLEKHLPGLAGQLTDIKPDHAGVRATTTDRWPIVGPLADVDFYQTEYADLRQGKQYKRYPAAHYQPGIFMNSGLGSRGLTSAAYCANLLSHMILGYAPPASTQIQHALHPARFQIRALRTGREAS